ncbi:hypothetical protein BGZ95_008476, partial [Linnemannia exigua]
RQDKSDVAVDVAVAAEDSTIWATVMDNRTTTTITTILSKVLEKSTTSTLRHKDQTLIPPPVAITTTTLTTMATIFNNPRPRGDGVEDVEAGS